MVVAQNRRTGSWAEPKPIARAPGLGLPRGRRVIEALPRALRVQHLLESRPGRSLCKSLQDIAILAHNFASRLHLNRKFFIERNKANSLRTFSNEECVA